MHPKYRPDIDGLRAVAMLAVVGFHAFPNLIPGGFIGVDIFFVISGYLISTIIMGSLERNRFSFTDFYIHRINRIFPALLLVLLACFAFGWFALFANELRQLGKHVGGGAGFISNYLFWRESGYFDNTAETKPLLHLWSLGIEEQYYLVWPLMLWFAWRKKFNMLKVTLLLAIASFGLNVASVNDGRLIEAFYSPQTRFWELLMGSVLAYITLHYQNTLSSEKCKLNGGFNKVFYGYALATNSKTVRNLYSLLGVTLFGIGFSLITREGHFPGWWALLPTFGAVLIISANQQAWINRNVLSSRIMVWFGLISYPLYLWHWPVLSYVRIIEVETPSIAVRAVAILISIALAWLTYQLIEKPFRFGGHKSGKAIILLILMAITGCVGFYTYQQDGFISREAIKAYEAHKKTTLEATDKSPQANLGLPEGKQAKVMVLGDSHGGRLAVGLAFEYGPYVANYTSAGCIPFYGVDRYDSRFVIGTCMKQMNEALDLFENSDSMNTIILSSMGPVYLSGKVFNGQDIARVTGDGVTLADHKEITDRYEVFKIGMTNTFKKLLKKNKHIIFVVDVPELGFDPHACIKTRPFQLSKKDICAVSRKEYDSRTEKYKKLIYSVLKDFPEVEVFDPTNLLCDNTWCNGMQDGKLLYFDPDHLSVEGSKYIVKHMVPIIEKYNPEIPKFN